MATFNCRSFLQPDPFQKRVVFEMQIPEGEVSGEAMPESLAANFEKTKGVKEDFKKLSETSKKAVRAILEKIGAGDDGNEAIQRLAELQELVEELARIEATDLPKDSKEAMRNALLDSYKDFEIDERDLNAIQQLQANAEERLALKEFYYNGGTASILLRKKETSRRVPAGKIESEFKVEQEYWFDPGFGQISDDQARGIERSYGLTKMLPDNVVKIQVKTDKGTKELTLKEGGFYAEGTSKPELIYSGAQIKILETKQSKAAKQENPPEEIPEGYGEHQAYDPFEYEQRRAEDEALLPEHGTLAAREAGMMLGGVPGEGARSLPFEEGTIGSLRVKEPTTETFLIASLDTLNANELFSKNTEVPAHYIGRTPFEHVRDMPDMSYGPPVYEALQVMAEIAGTDVQTVWRNIYEGDLINGGGRRNISVKEMTRAVYGDKARTAKSYERNKNNGSLDRETEFLAAAEQILNYLPKTTPARAGVVEYQSIREDLNRLSWQEREMAVFADQFFPMDNYGPYTERTVFEALIQMKRNNDRAYITHDNYERGVARSGNSEHEAYGEIAYTSHAWVWDQLMAMSNSPQEMVDNLNMLMQMGRAEIETIHEIEKKLYKRDPKLSKAPEALTLENLNQKEPAYRPTQEQLEAIRNGAMLYAAIEMGVYEAPESAPAPKQTNGTSARTMQELEKASGQEYSPEEKRENEGTIDKHLSGFLVALFDAKNPQDIVAAFGARKNISENVSINLAFSSGWWRNPDGKIRLQARDLQTGVEVEIPLENSKWEANTYARYRLALNPGGLSTPQVGVMASRAIGEKETLKVKAGGHINLESVAITLGLERDFYRILDERVNQFKEENREKIDDFNKKLSEQIQTIQEIEDGSPEEQALIRAVEGHLDERIRRAIIEKNTDGLLRSIKLLEFGGILSAGLYRQAGIPRPIGVGAYATLGVGAHVETVYVNKPGARNMETTGGQPIPTEWIDASGSMNGVLAEAGNAADLAIAQQKAQNGAQKIVNSLNRGLGEDIELTREQTALRLDFPNVTGTVDVVSSMPITKDFQISLGKEDPIPTINIIRQERSHGGETRTIIVINNTTQSDQNVIDEAGTVLSFTQNESGERTEVRPVQLKDGGAESPIVTLQELEVKDLSIEGADELIRIITYTDLILNEQMQAKVTLSDKEKLQAKNAAEKLASQVNYEQLALSGDKGEQALVTIIRGILAEEMGINADQVEIDMVNYVWDITMGMRPMREKEGIMEEWNEQALATIIGPEASRLYTQYMVNNKQGIVGRTFFGADNVRTGAHGLVLINNKGSIDTILTRYYKPDQNTKALAQIRMPRGTSEQELNDLLIGLGAERNEANLKAAKAMVESLRNFNDWPDSPFTNIDSPDDISFRDAAETPGGLHLMKVYEQTKYGTQLDEMYNGTIEPDPGLIAEYKQDLFELYKNLESGSEAMVDVEGIKMALEYEYHLTTNPNCINAEPKRSVVPKYLRAPDVSVATQAANSEYKQAMQTEQQVRYKEVGGVTPMLTPDAAGTGDSDQTPQDGPRTGQGGEGNSNDNTF